MGRSCPGDERIATIKERGNQILDKDGGEVREGQRQLILYTVDALMLTLLKFGRAKCHQGKDPDPQWKHKAVCCLQSNESACYICRISG